MKRFRIQFHKLENPSIGILNPNTRCVVYILCSTDMTRFYVGHTSDLKKRLKQHNAGKSKSTCDKQWFIYDQMGPFVRWKAATYELLFARLIRGAVYVE